MTGMAETHPSSRFVLLSFQGSTQGVRLLPEAVPTNLVTEDLSLIGLVGTTKPGVGSCGRYSHLNGQTEDERKAC